MTTEQTKELAARLKSLRQEKKLTAAHVAAKMGPGYSPQRIYNIESGKKNVGLVMISNYADACGYTTKIVFEEKK